jgi:hypothetical protein
MKRIVYILSILCLLLPACAQVPPPAETAPPATEMTLPPETTTPAEATVPAFSEYTVSVDDPETMLYEGPGFLNGVLGMVGEAGVYTVVEEATDVDGNTWGCLKSGVGWICLTNPPLAPIYADYAGEDFNAFYAYWSDETDYITSIGFTPGERLTNVKFGLLDWFETESWQMAEELYAVDELDPDHPFLAQVVFWGDMTTYGISFTDADGARRHYAVSISGKDGSLICSEYIP